MKNNNKTKRKENKNIQMKKAGLEVLRIFVVTMAVLIVAGCANTTEKDADNNAKVENAVNNNEDFEKENTKETEKILFDDRDAFVATVKENLQVPDDDIETIIDDQSESETVFVMFKQYGIIVAGGECNIKDGSMVRVVSFYSKPPKQEMSDIEEQPTEQEIKEVTPKKPDKPEKVTNAGVDYQFFYNGRYGFSLYVPTFLIRSQAPANGDGGGFVSEDGKVELRAFGSHTSYLGECTVDNLYEFVYKHLDYTPSYQYRTSNGFVISGVKDDEIIYEKYVLKSDETKNGFVIRYPQDRKAEFDPIVTFIEKNFQTGAGEDSPVER